MTFEEWFSSLNDDEPLTLKQLLEKCWDDAVIEGRNLQAFKDDVEKANEFEPDWDGTLELVEEIKRLAIENERLRHGEIKYEDWEFNPMTGESLWGKQPVSQEPFGYVNADEVVQHFASVNCGTIYKDQGENRVALYTTTQPVRTKDLTDDEILDVALSIEIEFSKDTDKFVQQLEDIEVFARAVIAADREKNK